MLDYLRHMTQRQSSIVAAGGNGREPCIFRPVPLRLTSMCSFPESRLLRNMRSGAGKPPVGTVAGREAASFRAIFFAHHDLDTIFEFCPAPC